MKSIKNYREKELKYYVLANILLIILVSGIIKNIVDNSIEIIELIKLLINPALVSSIIYIYVFIIDSLVPWNVKEKIVYLPKGKLPGYTIFSSMKKGIKDNRFTKNQILEKYSDIYDALPSNIDERLEYENVRWYEIYKKHQDKNMVITANKDFLLCRDMVISTLALFIMYLLLSLVFNLVHFKLGLMIFLATEIVILDISMRSKANRLAYNVICEDIYS